MAQGGGPSELVGTGRHLGEDELRVWTALLDSGRILDDVLESDLVRNYGMTHREYEVLVRLDGGGGSMRMSVLARQIEASPPLVTQTIERLEQRDWVERRPSADDRRGVDALLRPAGKRALARSAGPHAMLIKRLLLEPMSAEELSIVGEALTRVANHLRSHRRVGDCSDLDCPLNTT